MTEGVVRCRTLVGPVPTGSPPLTRTIVPSDRTASRALPDVLADRYHLTETIGTGGAGAVWRATDERLGRQVAIKLLHPQLEADDDTVARFRREATAAAAITHPNAVVIYDIGEDDGHVYLVMELVDGPTLADVLERGPLRPEAVAAIGCGVARALGEAHARDLVHRDVKPANVLLTRDGTAKVADFGIAKALGTAQTQLTLPGSVVGTAAYLAPEQLRGEDLDPRTDVYALGLVLHECLTGSPPFTGETAAAVTAQRLTTEAAPPRSLREDVPTDLNDIVVRATRMDPAERFANGTELADALEPLLPDEPATIIAEVAARRRETDRPPVATEQLNRTQAAPGRDDTTRVVPRDEDTDDRAPSASAPPPRAERDATAVLPPAAEETGRAATTARVADSATDTTPNAVHGHEPLPDDTDTETGEGGRRWPVALLAIGALVVLALVLALTLGGGSNGTSGSGDNAGQQSKVATIASGSAYDPFGSDGEHGEDVPKAFDGDPATAWETQHYNSADLGGLKPGVGIVFDLGEPRDVRKVQLDLSQAGVDFTLYAGDQPPSGTDPSGWGTPVDDVAGAGSSVDVPVKAGTKARYWLVWFTSLSPSGGRYQAGIAEARFVTG